MVSSFYFFFRPLKCFTDNFSLYMFFLIVAGIQIVVPWSGGNCSKTLKTELKTYILDPNEMSALFTPGENQFTLIIKKYGMNSIQKGKVVLRTANF